MAEIGVVTVGKWSVAFHHPTRATILRFEWTDRPPLNLAIAPEDAEAIANAILANYRSTPPRKEQMS